MANPSHITWGTVKPKVDAEIERVKEDLLTAQIADVPALQIRAQVLAQVKAWFERGARTDTQITASDIPY